MATAMTVASACEGERPPPAPTLTDAATRDADGPGDGGEGLDAGPDASTVDPVNPGCTPGDTGCFDSTPYTCDSRGRFVFADESCAVCAVLPGHGPSCVMCAPGAVRCAGTVPETCSAGGDAWEAGSACPGTCTPEIGCTTCEPGSRRCEGERSMLCMSDGSLWVEGRDCAEWGSACGSDGYCDDACAIPEREHTYIGCDFVTVSLPGNDYGTPPILFDVRVTLANVSDVPAHVQLTHANALYTEVDLDPGEVEAVLIPWTPDFAMSPARAQTVADAAYRIVSNVPITVSQFGPFEFWTYEEQDPRNPGVLGWGSHTQDASLVLPRHVMTGSYRIMTDGISSYAAVFGIDPEPTHVRVQASRGAQIWNFDGTVTYFDEAIEFTIRQGEVAILKGQGGTRYGFTIDDPGIVGAEVRADRPVAVFGGVRGNPAILDRTTGIQESIGSRLEAQLLPTESWGRSYVGGPLINPTEVDPPKSLVRVVAAENHTAVTVTSGIQSFRRVVDAGIPWDMWAHGPFTINASQPVSVGLISTRPPFGDNHGGPALTVLAPEEQFLDDYVFVTPSSYRPEIEGQSYIMVARPVGAPVELDGAPLETDWTNDGEMEIGYAPVEAGVHELVSSVPVGLQVYGFGILASYAYPGGLRLTQMQPPPGGR